MLLLCVNPDDRCQQGQLLCISARASSLCLRLFVQYVVSGKGFSMNFLLLAIQSTVCVSCVYTVKRLKVISFRDFDMQDAKNWFPISFLLVTVIYTGSKAIVSVIFNSSCYTTVSYNFC